MLPPRMSSTAPLLARAVQLLRAGRPAEAIAPLREAAALAPANAAIQHDFGLACLEVGLLPEAIAAFRRAVASKPGFADAHFRLAIALEKQGDYGAAIAAYDRATELLPGLTEAWYRAGSLVHALGHTGEAMDCFRRAAATGPKTSYGRLSAARMLLAEDRGAEAERVLRQTLALDKTNPIASDLLGSLLAEAGRFDEAWACFSRTIANAPMMVGAYYDLVRCRRITPGDGGLLAQMDAALAMPGLDPESRLRVHLARGKAADDLGDYAVAMHHFDAASVVRSEASPFDLAAFERQAEWIIGRFSPGLMAQAATLGSDDATPVFILGMPRSGTTLVEQIVSSHPDVAAGGELNFWSEQGVVSLQLGPAGIAAPFLTQTAADYLGLLRRIGPSAARVTDKMPFNFLWAGLIHLVFPRATIIHCRRAAIGTALSIHQTMFSPQLAFPTGGAELVGYFREYQRLTRHWRAVLPADQFIEVEYEALTSNPDAGIRRIVAACGLPWNDACLHPEHNARAVKTPSKWQTRQPIYRDAEARWRRYERWLGPLRALLTSEAGPPGATAALP